MMLLKNKKKSEWNGGRSSSKYKSINNRYKKEMVVFSKC